MKTRKMSQVAMMLILALWLLAGMVSAVGAADPWPWGQGLPWLTATPWPTPRVLRVGERFSFGAVIIPATPAPLPANFPAQQFSSAPSNFAPPAIPPIAPAPAVTARNGDSPTNALSPDGASRLLAAGASLWYKVGSGGEHIEVFLDANPLSGMSFSVFAPGNLSNPIGHGTLQKSSGRLVWAGGHWQSEGDWFARVTNDNPMAVQYALTSSARGIGKKSCYGYWEYLPTGQYIYWNECQ